MLFNQTTPHKLAPQYTSKDIDLLLQQAKTLLLKHNTVLVAHYYVSAELQALAEDSGGFVGDSLEMARFGQKHSSQQVMVAGVRFMGESAKILSPEKTILMPDLTATCSLDLSCPADEFNRFCEQHPDRTVVVYANTSAAVKARADWVVTSSIAEKIIRHLDSLGEKILWAPDRHLGAYLQQITNADILLWQGSCIVHEEFKANALSLTKEKYPEAEILAHPESPQNVLDLADFIGSTSQILRYATHSKKQTFVIATDFGLRYQLIKHNPHKTFIVAPTGGDGATCKSCAYCPWMAQNDLNGVIQALENPQQHQIEVTTEYTEPAAANLNKMIAFAN